MTTPGWNALGTPDAIATLRLMSANLSYDRCLSFLNCEMKSAGAPAGPKENRCRAVTLSRSAGSGAYRIAELLAERLTAADQKAPCTWAVFDGNLIERVLEDHQQSPRLAGRFPEDRLSEIDGFMDELFGLRPTPEAIVQQTSETILKLCTLGNVIIIGRGGNIVARRLPGVFHVRLHGSLETRVRRVVENRGMTPEAALAWIKQGDLGRQRYLRHYFDADINDPLLYHLILNTDLVSAETASELIGAAVLRGS